MISIHVRRFFKTILAETYLSRIAKDVWSRSAARFPPPVVYASMARFVIIIYSLSNVGLASMAANRSFWVMVGVSNKDGREEPCADADVRYPQAFPILSSCCNKLIQLKRVEAAETYLRLGKIIQCSFEPIKLRIGGLIHSQTRPIAHMIEDVQTR